MKRVRLSRSRVNGLVVAGVAGILALVFGARSARADYISYFANGEESREIDFGDGSDGVFNDGPTQAGITVAGGPTITINTDVKNEFKFSSFAASGTITVTGTRPLIIRVQNDLVLTANLTAEGAAGALAGTTRAGGAGVAGGGSGGNGGAQGGGAQPTPGSPSPAGGLAGLNQATQADQQAGGGGCNGPGATAGTPAGIAGGTCSARDSIASSFESVFRGGAGGGGGGAYVPGGAFDGAGGGAGGGAVHLTAGGNLTITGTIFARGRDGGAEQANGTDGGASGGGGAGGSVWIQTARTFAGAGTINVSGGAGGAAGAFGYTGGNGSRGVIRVDADTVTFANFIPGGAADLTYSVTARPVTTDFDLKGGLFCGTIRDRDGRVPPGALRNSILDFAVILLAVWFGRRYLGSSHARAD